MIPITKPYLPDRAKLNKYIDGIYERGWLTNNGPLLQELTQRLSDYLGVEHLLLVSNGTLALQIAYRALDIGSPVNGKPSEAITTPFTFVATASSLKWEGITPVFSDIDPDTWCLDPAKIQAAVTPQTKAIVPVHVYGNACAVEAIDNIAKQNSLKIIYDAAHAFSVNYKGESILKWGDAATLSFHATKVFHTIEGGAIVFKRKDDLERAKQLINFGITAPDEIGDLGINAKMNEFQAAAGLCMLDEIEQAQERRSQVWSKYDSCVNESSTIITQRQLRNQESSNNFAYYPLVLRDEKTLKRLFVHLQSQDIQARRYFFPSLDTTEPFNHDMQANCIISRDISSRVLCLPLFSELTNSEQQKVLDVLLTFDWDK